MNVTIKVRQEGNYFYGYLVCGSSEVKLGFQSPSLQGALDAIAAGINFAD